MFKAIKSAVIFGLAGLSGSALAALTDTPLPWTSFTFNPYTIAGVPIRDAEGGKSNDPSNGGASFNASTELASGYTGSNGTAANCNPALAGTTTCGPETTAFFQYYEPDGCTGSSCPTPDGDEYLVFRMRMESQPTNPGWDNEHWNVLLDIDGDGYKEFWVDVDGRDDEIHVYYEDLARQDLSVSPNPVSLEVEDFVACTGTTGVGSGSLSCATYSHTRATVNAPNSVPTSDTDDYFVDVQIPLSAFDNASGVQQITNTTNIRVIFSTSNSATDPVQKDFTAPCTTPPTGVCIFGDTTPVSLSRFESTRVGDSVEIAFDTVLETAHAGFVLEGKVNGRWQKLANFPADQDGNPNAPRQYQSTVKTAATEFRLIDLDARGQQRSHGPFNTGRRYGSSENLHLPNDLSGYWGDVIKFADYASHRADYQAKRHVGPSTLLAEAVVTTPGLYRIHAADLRALGIDPNTLPLSELGLQRGEQTIPTYVAGNGDWLGDQGFVEFVADFASTLYSRDARYLLVLNHNRTERVRVDGEPVRANIRGPKAYLASNTFERNVNYTFASPADADPWYEARLLAFGSPASYSGTFNLPSVMQGTASITFTLWGGAALDTPDEHRAVFALNGRELGDAVFDNLELNETTVNVPPGLLQAGANEFTIRVPGSQGGAFDLINFDKLTVRYNSAMLASGSRLDFTETGPLFEVGGFSESTAAVWSQDGAGSWTRMATDGRCSGTLPPTCQIRFNGAGQAARFVVAGQSVMRPATIQRPAALADLSDAPAQYLVVTHPLLLEQAQRLAAFHATGGVSVDVVTTDQIYREFGDGSVDALAISEFLHHAKLTRGTQWVVLLGADSYDYHGNLSGSAPSLIPSRYVAIDAISRFIPSDTALVDFDNDQFADLAIGRLPARSSAEAAAMVDKILRVEQTASLRRATFVTDRGGFEEKARSLPATLAAAWTTQSVSLETTDRAGVREQLFRNLAAGTDLVTYYGHSAPSLWSFENILSVNDADLTATQPFVAVQFGCWNNYHVDARSESLSRALMARATGTVAAIGATGLADELNEAAFAPLLLRRLGQGDALGDALNAAKREFANGGVAPRDILLGFNLLGDPLTRVDP